MISGLTGCDNHLFTQFFRNPHIVEVAQLDMLKAEQWYEFETDIKALNRTQEIWVKFKGSESGKLDVFMRGSDKHFQGGESVFKSLDFPNQEIKFNASIIDSNNVEYNFEASGLSGGIILHYDGNKTLIGKRIKEIKIKSNITHQDVEIKWMSRTGK